MPLGVHFALTEPEILHLKSLDDSDRRDYIVEEIEEDYLENEPEFSVETGKAWDAMHRLLSGANLSYQDGAYPLRLTVIGGEPLYFEDDYIMSLKTPDEVREIATALTGMTESAARAAYDAIDAEDYDGDLSDEDFGYTWENLVDVIAFYQRASEAGRYVLFTADQ